MTAQGPPLRVLYLVHDLNDAAVARRVGMLLEGGATVELAGFFRGEAPPAQVRGLIPHSLGQSHDARLVARAAGVFGKLAGAGRLARALAQPDVIVARNLEMLAIGASLRRRFKRPPALVYECLDIHRLMLSGGLAGKMLRRVEGALLADTAMLIVSSPAFVERYFTPRQAYGGPWMLVENRARAGPTARGSPRPPGPPWRIGWFGMLRCARSLRILAGLAAAGHAEALLAGKPARTELTDFDAVVASTPGLSYTGPYDAGQLAELYGAVHFCWAIDYFEEGLNSAWLLPNRLYEGPAHGAVPIALSQVQVGRWLTAHEAGVLLDDPAAELPAFLAGLDEAAMSALSAQVAAIPVKDVMFDAADSRDLVARLAGIAAHG